MADDDRDVDIVERALAILDEESRSWRAWQRAVAAPAEDATASGVEGEDGG